MIYFEQKFDNFVCVGDTIEAEFEGFDLKAEIKQDDDMNQLFADDPTSYNQGFWPSDDPKDCGYIGDSKKKLKKEQKKAQKVYDAFMRDEWFIGIVTVTVSRNGIELAGDSIGGTDVNYPSKVAYPNEHLDDWANELACGAIEQAKKEIKELAEIEKESGAYTDEWKLNNPLEYGFYLEVRAQHDFNGMNVDPDKEHWRELEDHELRQIARHMVNEYGWIWEQMEEAIKEQINAVLDDRKEVTA